MSNNCYQVNELPGIYISPTGVKTPITVVHEFRTAAQGEVVLYKVRYKQPDGTLLEPVPGSTIKYGEST